MVYFLAGRRKCPDWLWVPPSLLFSGYQSKVVGGTKLTIYLHQMLLLRMTGAIFPLSMCLHGMYRDSCMLLDLTLRFIPADKLHAQKGQVLIRPQWKDLNIILGV